MRNSSLWLRIVAVQLAIALVLAATLLFVVGRTINAIGNDLTEHLLGSAARRSIETPTSTEKAQPAGNDPRYGAVATFLVHGHGITQLAGPRIDDLGARPLPKAGQSQFSHGPFSDFYLLPTNHADNWVLAAEDRRHPAVILDDVIGYFLHRFAIIIILSFLLSVGSTLLILRLAMRPIRRVTSELASIDATNPTFRLTEADMPKDILPLVRATNVALAQLERAFDRERRFNATVTHELRTSLSTILLRAETLPEGRQRDAIETAVTRAAGVINQMLELGAIESGMVGLGTIRIAATARDVVDQMKPLFVAEDRKLTFCSTGDEAGVMAGSDALVTIALRNLIDNARRHSVAGGTVAISCDCDAKTLTVADDGPGLSVREDEGGQYIFARLDGVRSASSGLGLAIVRRAIETCGGSVAFARSGAGGALVTLSFRSPPE